MKLLFIDDDKNLRIEIENAMNKLKALPYNLIFIKPEIVDFNNGKELWENSLLTSKVLEKYDWVFLDLHNAGPDPLNGITLLIYLANLPNVTQIDKFSIFTSSDKHNNFSTLIKGLPEKIKSDLWLKHDYKNYTVDYFLKHFKNNIKPWFDEDSIKMNAINDAFDLVDKEKMEFPYKINVPIKTVGNRLVPLSDIAYFQYDSGGKKLSLFYKELIIFNNRASNTFNYKHINNLGEEPKADLFNLFFLNFFEDDCSEENIKSKVGELLLSDNDTSYFFLCFQKYFINVLFIDDVLLTSNELKIKVKLNLKNNYYKLLDLKGFKKGSNLELVKTLIEQTIKKLQTEYRKKYYG